MNCPVCNTDLTIQWPGTTLKQCTCNVIISKKDAGDWKIAMHKVARNQPATYIVVGTEGVYNKKKFTVAGRVCAQNEGTYINYWSIFFEDGSHALLAEGYGHYTIMTKTTAAFAINFLKFEKLKAGQVFSSNKIKFRIVRKEQFDLVTIEGENEWPDIANGFGIFDFFREEGEFTQIVRFSNGFTFHLDCQFFKAHELKLSKTATQLVKREHICNACKTVNVLHAFPYTYTISCIGCGQRYVYDRKVDMYQRAKQNDKGFGAHIELGSNGILDGIEFKVIGYARKEETNMDAAQWSEYTLYNPEHGFAYLSEFQGHWVYLKEWPRPPLITSQGSDYFVENSNEFELFNDYYYRVVGAYGEHIYDLSTTTNFYVKEFIYPPQVLAKELNATEENWFYGDHIEGKKVASSFSMPSGLPMKLGVGAVQPVAFINKKTFFLVGLIGIAAVILLHLVMSGMKLEKPVYAQQSNFSDYSGTIMGTSPVFNLPKKESNLEVIFFSPVSNSWMELEGTFVNTKTGKEYSFNKGIEYYFGYSDGENWSEGSRTGSVVLTEIPAGNYYLEYKATKDSTTTLFSNATPGLDISVKYDVPVSRNLWWAMGFIVIVAAAQFAFYYYYDKRRWENSKYTPYNYE